MQGRDDACEADFFCTTRAFILTIRFLREIGSWVARQDGMIAGGDRDLGTAHPALHVSVSARRGREFDLKRDEYSAKRGQPMEPKRRINLWVHADVLDAIEQEAKQSQRPMTDVADQWLREGIARSQQALHQSALPALQTAIQQALEQPMADLLATITTLQHKEQVQYRDLLTLIVRAIHQAGIAWRLSYMVLGQTIAEAELHQIYADAEHHVQEQITRLDINGLDR